MNSDPFELGTRIRWRLAFALGVVLMLGAVGAAILAHWWEAFSFACIALVFLVGGLMARKLSHETEAKPDAEGPRDHAKRAPPRGAGSADKSARTRGTASSGRRRARIAASPSIVAFKSR
jgi:uncharacterized membrane protein YfcA